ncbi:MAG: type IV secretory system conjugative DNA transfer family protein, partial [Eggerthellaceae bacterium]|nr:type IV secretory system conjugative DNA transfer family protein [Eggerthellaceae bacterium]
MITGKRRAEMVVVAVLAVIAAIVANHFAELMGAALAQDFGARYAFARSELLRSFLPGSGVAFVLGMREASLATGALTGLLVFGLYLVHVFKGTFRKGEEHGSARFATKEEIGAFSDSKVPTNNVVLARDFRLQAHGSPDYEHSRNRNVLVIGGSGAGKTFGYLKPNLMQLPAVENETPGCSVADMEREARSFFVTDSKGTTSVDTGFLMAEHGYEVKMFNVVDFGKSLHFNPFLGIT